MDEYAYLLIVLTFTADSWYC